jgi:hypothetical protein
MSQTVSGLFVVFSVVGVVIVKVPLFPQVSPQEFRKEISPELEQFVTMTA